jgi:hypothetical protein
LLMWWPADAVHSVQNNPRSMRTGPCSSWTRAALIPCITINAHCSISAISNHEIERVLSYRLIFRCLFPEALVGIQGRQ